MKTQRKEKINKGASHGSASTISHRAGMAMGVTDNRTSASTQLQRQMQPDQRQQFVQLKRHLDSLNQDQNGAVQRVEEEEPLQGKFDAVQRVEEEEPLQGKFADVNPMQRKAETPSQTNNSGLPNQLKAGIESLSGMSMDHVKVHYNSAQPAQLNAHAYAQGSEIHVAPGQEQHLPHEAWHVVQQAQGRVQPTMQMKQGVSVNDDAGLETEADVMGAKANAAGQSLQMKTTYDGSVKIKTKITSGDMNDWGAVRLKLDNVVKGGDANDVSSKVNTSLSELGLSTSETAMSAHMIPNRIGGVGNNSNVRPWKSSFETGTWETSVEQAFNQELPKANVDDIVAYKVTTTDMDSTKAAEIVGTSTVDTEKAKAHHKDRIEKIPLAVTATVGSSTLAETKEPFTGLIKGVVI